MTSKSAEKQAQHARALQVLRDAFPQGSDVSTVVTYVTRSGMARDIMVLKGNPDGTVEDLSWAAARALGWKLAVRGVRVNGCGMDMAFHLVDTLGRELYGKSYALTKRGL